MAVVFVTGATGSIGGAVTQALLDRGATVRALVRSPERAALLPDGVQPVFGDLGDPASVEAALAGVTSALYVSPHDPAEERLAAGFVAACERTGARLVFVGVHTDSRLLSALVSVMLPQYRGKLRLAKAIARAKASPVVFSVPNYFQNDEIVREDILAGHYPLPTHRRGVNRIDLRDAGEIAARALTDPAFPAGSYALCGPASIPAAEAAAVWTRVLGRPVAAPGADWAERLGAHLTGQKRSDVLRTYTFLAKMGMPTTAKQVAVMTRLLGRPPRAYAEYVADTAAAWTSAR